MNKLFAGLRVPKVYLGWEEALPGSLGSTSLTRLDSRYARTVKKVQRVLKEGVRDLVDFYCLVTNEDRPDYKVCMMKVSTADEADNLEELRGKTEVADSLLRVIDSIQGIDYDREELMDYIVTSVLDLRDFVKFKNAPGSTSEQGASSNSGPDTGLPDSDFEEPEETTPPLEPESLKLDRQVKQALQERMKKTGKITVEDIDYIIRKFG